jgi:hypothetical protein
MTVLIWEHQQYKLKSNKTCRRKENSYQFIAWKESQQQRQVSHVQGKTITLQGASKT